jgi:hypothetical protein
MSDKQEEKKEEEKEEDKEDVETKPKKIKKEDLGPMDATMIEKHSYHMQNPGAYYNNCTYSGFFAYLELLTLMCIQLPTARYKAVTSAGIRVHACLERLQRLFRNVAKDPQNHDPVVKSATCLKLWFEMCKDLSLPDELPEYNTATKKYNCVGGIQKAIIAPLNSICQTMIQKMCACAVAMQDDGKSVRWNKPAYISIRYI